MNAAAMNPVTLEEAISVVDEVVSRMGRHLPSSVSQQDLASAGRLALAEACHDGRFLGSHAEVRSFCRGRVRGAIMDELRRLDPLSRYGRDRVKRVRRVTEELERELGHVPSAVDVAEATGMSIGEVESIEQLGRAAAALSLDCPEGRGQVAGVPDETLPCPRAAATSSETVGIVAAALGRLTVKQALVLRRFYFEGATLAEIAQEMRISTPAVFKLRSNGEKALRADMEVLRAWESIAMIST